MRDEIGGGFRIDRRPDDQRIVAAEFERQQHVRTARELAVDQRAGLRRAGEEHAVEARCIEQRRAGFARALQQIEHARGQARFIPRFHHQRADAGRQFARLEQHRVAGKQRRHDVAVGQMAREVERAEHAEHAVRMMREHVAPKAVFSSLAPARSACARIEISILPTIACTSPRASHSALPISRLMVRAISSPRRLMISPNARTMATRSSTGPARPGRKREPRGGHRFGDIVRRWRRGLPRLCRPSRDRARRSVRPRLRARRRRCRVQCASLTQIRASSPSFKPSAAKCRGIDLRHAARNHRARRGAAEIAGCAGARSRRACRR